MADGYVELEISLFLTKYKVSRIKRVELSDYNQTFESTRHSWNMELSITTINSSIRPMASAPPPNKSSTNKCTPRQRLCHLTWTLACFVGFCGQTFMVTKSFIDENTVTRSRVLYPPEILVPAISICFSISDIVDPPNDDCLASRIGIPTNSTRAGFDYTAQRNKCDFYLTGLKSMDELVDRKISSDFDDLVTEVNYASNCMGKEHERIKQAIWPIVGDDDTTILDASYVSNFTDKYVHVFSKKHLKCFRLQLFDSDEKNTYDKFAVKFDNDMGSQFLRIHFNFEFYPQQIEYYMYIHTRNTLPRTNEQRIELVSDNDYVLSYTKLRTRRQLSRFRTNCLNYPLYTNPFNSSIKLESRDHLIEACMESNVSESKLSTAYIQCEYEFNIPDCTHVKYSPTVVKNEPSTNKEQVIVSFVLPEDETEFNYYHQVTLEEYLVYLSSVSGIWFGFSFFGLFALLSNVHWKRD